MEIKLFTGDVGSHTLYRLGIPQIEMVQINRESNSVYSIKNDYLRTLNIYDDKLV